jgi:subtilisin-like proprotein convertase family protein
MNPYGSTADPYPSSIEVSGLKGTITDLDATIDGLSHYWVEDVDILLQGPYGQTVVLLADRSGAPGVAGASLTFDDAALAYVPGPIVSGTYKPTNLGAFNGGLPAPLGVYGATMAGFNGTDPNGTWFLYVFDDYSVDDGGSIGGWSLEISTNMHQRAIKAALIGTKVKGMVAVEDGFLACTVGVPVIVESKVDGVWKTLGRTRTSPTGAFSLGGASERTQYRAIAKKTVLGSDTCLKVATKPFR